MADNDLCDMLKSLLNSNRKVKSIQSLKDWLRKKKVSHYVGDLHIIASNTVPHVLLGCN